MNERYDIAEAKGRASSGQHRNNLADTLWSPMSTAPQDRTTIEALVPLKDGGFVQGRVYFEAEAYDGSWWWVEGPAYDYHADAIDECNHGNPGYWLEGSEGEQMSSIAFIDQTMARLRNPA